MLAYISKLLFKFFGWKITGEFPDEIKKLILVAAPHTSWTDFFIGIAARAAIQKKIKFIGKHTLFKGLLGWIMRGLGGIPVDRSRSTNFVQAVAELYDSRESLYVVISPEGTRKKVEKFKTGFYYIARAAKIPILLVKFDYQHKAVHFGPVFWAKGEPKEDIREIENEFRGVIGKVPAYSFS